MFCKRRSSGSKSVIWKSTSKRKSLEIWTRIVRATINDKVAGIADTLKKTTTKNW